MRYVVSKDHVYLCIGLGKNLPLGITDYAVKQLGAINFITLPYSGQTIEKGEPFCEIEGTNMTMEIIAPANAIINDVNLELDGSPELLAEDSKKNWICQVELRSSLPLDILSEEKYLKWIKTL